MHENDLPGVVIADDHPDMRTLIERILSPHARILAAVPDGGALITAASRFQPDLFVVDIDMPVRNGFDAVEALREDGVEAPVVIVTSSEERAYLDRAIEVGAIGFVAKSRLATDLIPAFEAALDGRRFASRL